MVGEREAPATVVAELQEILPGADLVSLDNGEWMLGYWAPFNRVRYEAAVALLDRELSLPVSRKRDNRIVLLRMYLEGFKTILPNGDSPLMGPSMLGYETDSDFGRIREELREKEYGLQRADAAFMAMVERSEAEEREGLAALLDRLDAEGPSDFRIRMRHRESIINPRNWN